MAKRIERPGWINLRSVLGLVLFAVAFLGAQRIIEGAGDTADVWVAGTDLAAGEVLDASDLMLAPVQLPPEVRSGYALEAAHLTGAVITRPVRAGELIPIAWVASADETATARSIALPVTPEHAVGGDLGPGDRIDVLATFDSGTPQARTVVLARDIEVIDVVVASGLGFGEDAVIGVTVSVVTEDATRLAFAIRSAEVDLVKVTGPPDDGGQPGSVSAEDFR